MCFLYSPPLSPSFLHTYINQEAPLQDLIFEISKAQKPSYFPYTCAAPFSIPNEILPIPNFLGEWSELDPPFPSSPSFAFAFAASLFMLQR